MDTRDARSKAADYGVILWDNDGVLVDTERLYFQATREAFAGVGVELTADAYFEYFLVRSGGTSKFGAAQGLGETDIAALQEVRNSRYERSLEQEGIIISGIRETLERLRPHFVMGVVTNSRRLNLETMHRRTGLLELMDFAITREDCVNGKPAPDPYLAGVARSGFRAGLCVAIEDAPRGLEAARAAGIDCWVVRTELTRRAAFAAATRVVEGVGEVAGLLLDGKSE